MAAYRTSGVPDLLQMAHLAYIRGDLTTARRIVDELLIGDPQNPTALRLRDAIESQIVERQAAAIRNEGWLSRLEPTRLEVALIVLSGLVCIALAGYWAIWPVQMAIRYGLTAQVRHRVGVVTYATSPVHYLLAGPLFLAAFGGFLLYSVLAFLHELRDRSRQTMD
jgi:hypothetical protein